MNKFKVWGDGLFADKSSICRAALFAGIIPDDKGGAIHV
jgi:hypothetical protein